MVKTYSLQIVGTIPPHLDSSTWLEKYKVQLTGTSLSENIILIECEDFNLANFLKHLNFAKLK